MVIHRGSKFDRRGSYKSTDTTVYANPARQPNSPFAWVYVHPRWRALRQMIIETRGERCEDRYHDPSLPVKGYHLDHVRELQDGGAPFDPANVKLLCHRCHALKTKYAAKRRAVLAHLK